MSPAGAGQELGELFALGFRELVVGDRFATLAREITEEDILEFAALTGDGHPQHTDPDWASESRFGERIAHGLLIVSFAVGLLPLDPDRIVALRRVSDAVFEQPVKIGDTVHVEGEIARTQELDEEQGLVEARLRIVNQAGRARGARERRVGLAQLMLDGKRLLITGMLRGQIAYSVAERAQERAPRWCSPASGARGG